MFETILIIIVALYIIYLVCKFFYIIFTKNDKDVKEYIDNWENDFD